MECVGAAAGYGYGTVVLQAGEDYGIGTGWLAHIIRRIKAETRLAVTLSMGERPDEDLRAWRRAGADRYLLRFETSDPDLYRLIHPSPPGKLSDRLATLQKLREMGYEVGGGVMIGIPGQTCASLADDIELFRALDLDMIGLGPYIPHPETPLGKGEWKRLIPQDEQALNTEEMTYKMIALARIVCPEANIPSTTALATVNSSTGRELGLMRGANVVMPNMTPWRYRVKYEVYPGKTCVGKDTSAFHADLCRRIQSIGRRPGQGRGDRVRPAGTLAVDPTRC
jgi:biotin synthase